MQSREQYRTLLHEMQGFKFGDPSGSEESSTFWQLAQQPVGDFDGSEDEAGMRLG